MPKHVVSVLFFIGALGTCVSGTDPLTVGPLGPGTLAISLDRASYTWDEASANGIRGSVRNTGERLVYSRIGDAMLIATEQDPLHISDFSDGAIERLVGSDAWSRVPTLHSIEGVRFVVLRPGQSYRFIGNVRGTPQLGIHRVAISYRTTINDEESGSASIDYSPNFEVR